MHITDADIQNTLLELFARKGLVEGDILWMSRLEQFWADTRLRRSDLLTGVATLCSKGLLDMDDQDGEINLSLTCDGAKTATAILDAGTNYCTRYLREQLLPKIRLKDEARPADGSGRRGYEQAVADIPTARNAR